MDQITQDFLKEHFKYCEGHLWWTKPRATNIKIGRQLGCLNGKGYRQGKIFGKIYLEHRLVWLYHYGDWPKSFIDHINTIRDDNRIENLRLCTVQQNGYNRKNNAGSLSKYKGVTYIKSRSKWMTQYCHNQKIIYLGTFTTEEEAAEAYRNATEHIHKEYANYG